MKYKQRIWVEQLQIDNEGPFCYLASLEGPRPETKEEESLRLHKRYLGAPNPIPLIVAYPGIMPDVSDVGIGGNSLILSKKAKAIIEPMVSEDSLQFFPAIIENGTDNEELYIVNILAVLNAINWKQTRYTLRGGRNNNDPMRHWIKNYTNLVLRSPAIPEHAIFTLNRLPALILFTDSIIKALKASDCTFAIDLEEVKLTKVSDDSPSAQPPYAPDYVSRLP